MHLPSSTPRQILLAISGALLATSLACSSPADLDPLPFDPCLEITCDPGLSCDADTGACLCDDHSCLEGFRCSDDRLRCEESLLSRCAFGEQFLQGSCQCDPESCTDSWACSPDGARCQPEDLDDQCLESRPWDGESPLFEEISSSAGIADLGVVAVRLSSADLTGNGYPDLIVRRGGLRIDDFGPEGTRSFWFLANQGDGTFEDFTEESGLLARRDGDSSRGRPAEVVAFADLNNNSHLDAITLFSGVEDQEGGEVLFNDGTGRFTLGPISEPLHSAGIDVARSSLSFLDLDRNGLLDLWIPHAGAQNRLLLGDGEGRFVDATDERGLTTLSTNTPAILNNAGAHGHTWSSAACDLTGNGLPELLAGNYGRAPNHLWLGADDDGLITFQNHSVPSGYAFDHRQDWSDNESARCYCKLNRDAEDCEDVPEPELIRCNSPDDVLRWNHAFDREPFRLGGNSGTTVCGDLNNNGRLDLLTTEIIHWDVGSSSDPSEILYNSGEDPLRFERPGNEATGLLRPRSGVVFDDGDITAALFDFDNDGRLDILIASTDYPGTRAHLYHQQPDGSFELLHFNLGIDLTSAHGVAVADFNRNGYLDVAIGHSRSRCSSGDHCLDDPHLRLFQNTAAARNNWIQLHLEGAPGTNRAAIGAQVTVVTDELLRTAQVDGGHGHYGIQHDLTQHFGLGAACEATVLVRWPDAELSEEIFRLPAGHRYHIVQGEAPKILLAP